MVSNFASRFNYTPELLRLNDGSFFGLFKVVAHLAVYGRVLPSPTCGFVLLWLHITKTYLYNFDSLKPHFYIVKLGIFTIGLGVYIIFLIFC